MQHWGYPFPNPLALPVAHPPLDGVGEAGSALARPDDGRLDIGAFEAGEAALPPTDDPPGNDPPPDNPPDEEPDTADTSDGDSDSGSCFIFSIQQRLALAIHGSLPSY